MLASQDRENSSQPSFQVKTSGVLIIVAVLLTALRVGLVVSEDPSPTEAYYFLCAEKSAPAYFDGPAGTACLVGGLEALGLPEEAWRLLAPFWALTATLACYLLLRRVGDDDLAAWAALGLNALPLVNTAALRVGPELPALTATALAMLFVWRAYHARSGKLLWWLAAAVMMGTASSFAYVTVAWVPALIVFVFCSPKHRKLDHVLGAGLFFLLPALMLGPALAWNAALEWIPVAGGTLRTLLMFRIGGFFISLGQLAMAFSPLVLVFMLLAWVRDGRESHREVRSRFLFLGALPGVVLCGYFALRGQAAGFPLLLAVPLLLLGFLKGNFRSGWKQAIPGASFTVAVVMSAYSMMAVFQSGEGWRAAAGEVRDAFLEQSAAEGEGVFLVAGDPALASVLGYHLRNELVPPAGHPTVYVGESQDVSNQFGLWPSYGDFVATGHTTDEYFTEEEGENPFLGRSALYISHEAADDLPQTIKAAFVAVNLLEKLPPVGGDAEPLYIYQCLDYQTQPL